MEFTDLENVNKDIKTTNIKGKDYAEVNERITAFRKLFPTGFITTEVVEKGDGVVLFKATAGYYRELETAVEPVILGVGHAYEYEDANPINKTSFIEVAETSAIGRALGGIGIGVASALASADEVTNAIQIQAASPMATAAQIKMLERLYHGEQRLEAMRKMQVASFNELTVQQASQLIKAARND